MKEGKYIYALIYTQLQLEFLYVIEKLLVHACLYKQFLFNFK